MPAVDLTRVSDELAREAVDLYARRVRPALSAADDGKFVAIDVASGDYEVDTDDYSAVSRLRARRPGADIWLERAGEPTAYKMRGVR